MNKLRNWLAPKSAALKTEISPGSAPLTVEQYDAAELEGSARLSIPHLMAFRPVTFQMVGWPTQVKSEAELLRYVDHNFEAEVPGLFKPGAEFEPVGYRNSFSFDEKELIGEIRAKVAELTETSFGKRIVPVTNLLVQTGPFRAMHQLASIAPGNKLAVFEVGPGAGYLGAMLAQSGHRYLSYDVAQSLYLWQNRLLAAVAGPDLCEVAGREDELAGKIANRRVVHLPWWTYAGFLSGSPAEVDVVYSNSNLSEMTNLALRHVLHISRQMLSKSELGLFCFFSKGMPSQTPHEALDGEFRLFGYHKVFEKPFHAYVLNREHSEKIRQLFRDGIKLYDRSDRPERFEAKDVVPLRREEAPPDVHITQWFHGWEPPFTN